MVSPDSDKAALAASAAFRSAVDAAADGLDAPPSYNSHTPPPERAPTEHVYHMRHGDAGQPWLTLSFPSWASAADEPPYLYGSEPLMGTVTLDLVKPEWIMGIDLTVRLHCLSV
jgi:hypothetical protein